MKKITIRISDQEHQQLAEKCEQLERSINDVLRELIREFVKPDK
ncbi:MAG TPA: ribbon-helix-helix protein, CopG family [Allocoleopsis sp.]